MRLNPGSGCYAVPTQLAGAWRVTTTTDEFYRDIIEGLAIHSGALSRATFWPRSRVTRRGRPRRRASTRTRWRASCGCASRCSKPCGPAYANVTILGGWFGVLAAVLLHDPRFSIGRVTSVDIDPRCEAIARSVNATHVRTGRFVARTADMLDLDYGPPIAERRRPAHHRSRNQHELRASARISAAGGSGFQPASRSCCSRTITSPASQHVNCVPGPGGLSRAGADEPADLRGRAPDEALHPLHADRAEVTGRNAVAGGDPRRGAVRLGSGRRAPRGTARRRLAGRDDGSAVPWARPESTCAFAARPKVRDEAIDRRIGADEQPPAPPRDDIDVRIALHKLAPARRQSRGPNVDNPRKPATGSRVDDARVDPVPRRNEHRHEACAESSRELGSARLQFGDDRFDRPMRTELPVALTGRRVIAMRVSVLEDRRSRCALAARRRRGSVEPRGMTARATGTFAVAAISSSRESAGESRHASSSRHHKSSATSARLARGRAHRRARASGSGDRPRALGDELRRRSMHCARRRRCRSPTCPTARAFRPSHGRSGEDLGRVRAIVDHDGEAELGEPHGARALLGFAVAGEGNDHRPRAARHDVEHGVVAALRDRDERPSQQRSEIGTRAFDDRVGPRVPKEALDPHVRECSGPQARAT